MRVGRDALFAILLSGLLVAAGPALAALPPQHQNAKDLDALVAFVKAHARVIASLEGIDLHEQRVRFGNGCEARFDREPLPAGMVGPARPLRLQSANCPLD
ncbi:MAG: hypothetical protein WCG13_01145 [Burkholderiales bacterium]|jgi:hypothetical protein